MAEHIATGQLGEDLAASYLKGEGFKILARNVANPFGKRLGELDIVAEQKKEIVFVEVKTLRERPDGEEWLPEWNATPRKFVKLERIAAYYLKKEGLSERSYRFDVVAVTLREGKEPSIKHIEYAFY
ncbi:MAG: YraN family protein [Candidatus Moraniibacteriota bacterium]